MRFSWQFLLAFFVYLERYAGTGLWLLTHLTYLNSMLFRYEPRPKTHIYISTYLQHGRTLWEKHTTAVLLTQEKSQIHHCGSVRYCCIMTWLSGGRLQFPHIGKTSLTQTYLTVVHFWIFEHTGLLAFCAKIQKFKKFHENTCFPQYLLKEFW